MQRWPEGGVDGFEVQELAEKFSILIKVDGGYDPEIHGECEYDSDPGGVWLARNYVK